MFYFQTNALGFSPEFLGRVRLAGALASLVGVGVYNAALKELPLRRMFLWTAVLGAGLGMTQILLITGARWSLLHPCILPAGRRTGSNLLAALRCLSARMSDPLYGVCVASGMSFKLCVCPPILCFCGCSSVRGYSVLRHGLLGRFLKQGCCGRAQITPWASAMSCSCWATQHQVPKT